MANLAQNESAERETFAFGRASDHVASALGASGRTYEKAKAVVTAAEADPDLAPLVAQMDRTGKVDGAYKQLVRQPAVL
ncbi:MAG: hypothetical protein RBR18_14515 [Desulfovibrionaceae bacterium]|nr:hypothetical protein [Desulfovibrionaceae bacterium]